MPTHNARFLFVFKCVLILLLLDKIVSNKKSHTTDFLLTWFMLRCVDFGVCSYACA